MNIAFKLVCIDDSCPFEFQVLDDVNRSSLDDIFQYMNEHINDINIETCKWLLLPIIL